MGGNIDKFCGCDNNFTVAKDETNMVFIIYLKIQLSKSNTIDNQKEFSAMGVGGTVSDIYTQRSAVPQVSTYDNLPQSEQR